MAREGCLLLQLCLNLIEVHSGLSQFDSVSPKAVITFTDMEPGLSPFARSGVDQVPIKFAVSFR
jgi:hypothetical protein